MDRYVNFTRKGLFDHDQKLKSLLADDPLSILQRERPLPDRALKSKPSLGAVPYSGSSSSGSGGPFIVIITVLVIVVTILKLLLSK